MRWIVFESETGNERCTSPVCEWAGYVAELKPGGDVLRCSELVDAYSTCASLVADQLARAVIKAQQQ